MATRDAPPICCRSTSRPWRQNSASTAWTESPERAERVEGLGSETDLFQARLDFLLRHVRQLDGLAAIRGRNEVQRAGDDLLVASDCGVSFFRGDVGDRR